MSTSLESGLEALVSELKSLRDFKTFQEAFTKDLEKKLDHAEYWVRKLREKCSILEKKPVVMDGVDEQWLWDNQATLTFKRGLDGRRRLEIRSRGRVLARESELRAALEEASGRTRGRKAHQA